MTPSKVPEPLFVLANFLTNRLEVSTMISKGFQPQLFLVKALPLPGSVGETGDLLITHYWAVFWSLTSESALIFTQAAKVLFHRAEFCFLLLLWLKESQSSKALPFYVAERI